MKKSLIMMSLIFILSLTGCGDNTEVMSNTETDIDVTEETDVNADIITEDTVEDTETQGEYDVIPVEELLDDNEFLVNRAIVRYIGGNDYEATLNEEGNIITINVTAPDGTISKSKISVFEGRNYQDQIDTIVAKNNQCVDSNGYTCYTASHEDKNIDFIAYDDDLLICIQSDGDEYILSGIECCKSNLPCCN